MPKKIEDKLKREARKKFPNDKEKQNAYVYGTLTKIEIAMKKKPKNKKKKVRRKK